MAPHRVLTLVATLAAASVGAQAPPDAHRRDANNLISPARTWQCHNIGDTAGFAGDHERALRSIQARVLYMPCETDLYFPLGDARYESQFIPAVSLVPIPSLWGHSAGSGGNAVDNDFIDAEIHRFLK
jgi:homoserine O-acetyltransferase